MTKTTLLVFLLLSSWTTRRVFGFLLRRQERPSFLISSSVPRSLLVTQHVHRPYSFRPSRKAGSIWSSALKGKGLFGDDNTYSENDQQEQDQQREEEGRPRRRRKGRNVSSKKSNWESRYAVGEGLKRLRSDLDSLRQNLAWATAMKDDDRIADLTQAIRNGEARDPDIAYDKALRQVQQAKNSPVTPQFSSTQKQALLDQWNQEAQAARSCLQRFQLEGLWMGNYGDHGHELINVTYVGDTLIATKITGDVNVPRGQVSFTADLAPHNNTALEPLNLFFEPSSSSSSSNKSPISKAAQSQNSHPAGTKVLRYPGKGQIARPGFVDHKYVEGQFVMFEEHFSFVWIPNKHHVLFKRPTPEQTLELLRDIISKEDELENMRSHVERCFTMDMTDSLARYHAQVSDMEEPFRRILQQEDLNSLKRQDRERQKQRRQEHQQQDANSSTGEEASSATVFNFWHVHKWREFIDHALHQPHNGGDTSGKDDVNPKTNDSTDPQDHF